MAQYKPKQAQFEFYRVMNELRKVQKMNHAVHNMKFDVHLRNFGGDFDKALLRIKSCNLEKHAIR